MCGICGYISEKKYPISMITRMNNTMYHRGPDVQETDYFVWGSKMEAHVGHCRLSILDLRAEGNQPMWNEDHKYCIVYNGEVYNFHEIRNILINEGFSFHTKTDTEVILKSYIRWGKLCVKKLNGMFSFVIFDIKSNTVFFARDRFGKKPLFYYYGNNELAFASELKPLIECDFIKKEINSSVLAQYLRYGYVPSPQTIFKHIYKLPMGSYMEFNNKSIQITSYWKPSTRYHNLEAETINSYVEAKQVLGKVLEDSVRDRLVADVPVGVFLSSGIDSSLVATLAQKVSSNKINTYTIGVDDPNYNEAKVAKSIAEHIGTNHHEYYMTEQDLLSCIESIPQYFDEPFGDTSLVPNMVLAKIVRKDITVALGGDGGDELFCGYPHYSLVKRAQLLDSFGKALYYTLPQSVISRLPSGIQRVVNNRDKDIQCQIVSADSLNMYSNALLVECNVPVYKIEQSLGIKDWQTRRMILDMETTLCDDMLQKVDRAAMSASLEVRSPILDYRVAEVSYRLPIEYKFHNNITKRILRDIVYKYVPKEILNVPKRGFCVPVENWMRINLKELFMDILHSNSVREQGYFNENVIGYYFERFCNGDSKFANICWNFLIFQLWHKKYCKK